MQNLELVFLKVMFCEIESDLRLDGLHVKSNQIGDTTSMFGIPDKVDNSFMVISCKEIFCQLFSITC